MASPGHSALRGVAVFLATVLAGAVACSGSGSGGVSCAHLDPCPQDPPLSQSEISQCQSLVNQCPGYQAYLDCAVASIKCTGGGTLDSAASRTAIESNCQSQAGALSGCAVSVSGFDGGGSCGFTGEACCTTGAACQSGCCDPGTSLCVYSGGSCSGSKVCSGSTCQPCGGAGEPCCNGQCNGGACCNYVGSSSLCVAPGNLCPTTGSTTEVCSATNHYCEPCGGDGEACCPASTCPGSTTSFPLYCDSTSNCSPCGSLGYSCCPGNTCVTGTCSAGTCQ